MYLQFHLIKLYFYSWQSGRKSWGGLEHGQGSKIPRWNTQELVLVWLKRGGQIPFWQFAHLNCVFQLGSSLNAPGLNDDTIDYDQCELTFQPSSQWDSQECFPASELHLKSVVNFLQILQQMFLWFVNFSHISAPKTSLVRSSNTLLKSLLFIDVHGLYV